MRKQSLLTAVIILIAMSSCAQRITGNGNTRTITRSTAEYEAIKCTGFMDFELIKGPEGRIEIQGEENLLEYIVTEVIDGQLVVKVKDQVSLNTGLRKGIKITIPFQDVNRISLTGSGDLWTRDMVSADVLEVLLSGSGDARIQVKTQDLKSKLSGSGDLTLRGSTINLEAGLTGSGDIDASELSSDNTNISVTGSGDASVVSHKALRAQVTGSGDIQYAGNPSSHHTKVTGSGSIHKR